MLNLRRGVVGVVAVLLVGRRLIGGGACLFNVNLTMPNEELVSNPSRCFAHE
jgi:hypothetical protein